MMYTDSHEWISLDTSGIVTIGVTDFAQNELGEIVFIELPLVGKMAIAGQEMAVLESTKAAADVYFPVSGEILEVNNNLKESPGLINREPESSGWICKVRLLNSSDLNNLMDEDSYNLTLNNF